MAPLAVIINPLSVIKGRPTAEIYTSFRESGKLAYEQRYFDKGVGVLTGDRSKPDGIVCHFTSMAGFVVNNVIQVYGVNQNGDFSLCQPVYQPLNIQTSYKQMTGCSDNDQRAWIYYVARDSNHDIQFYELSIGNAEYNPKIVSTPSGPDPGTFLTSCFDGTDRWLAYQEAGRVIVLTNMDKTGTVTRIGAPEGNDGLAPLALLFVPADGSESIKGRIFLYYIQTKHLYRVLCELLPGKSPEFKDPHGTLVAKNATTHTTLQISAVYDPVGSNNVVFTFQGDNAVSNVDHWKGK